MSLGSCPRCKAVLSGHEVTAGGCACGGPARSTNAEVLYAVACAAPTPLPVHDLVRLAANDHGSHVGWNTAGATISTDPRFCWAGKGTYGLYRHGVLPGPRKLEEAARLVVLAAGPLPIDAVEFILKYHGYRFASGSLRNALATSPGLVWDFGGWSYSDSEYSRLMLRQEIQVVPYRQRGEFDEIIERLAKSSKKALREKERRQARVPDTFGLLSLEWS